MFSLGLMILTLIRAIQSWRAHSSRLYVVLVKHNIFYYTCGFCELTLTCVVFPCSFRTVYLSWSVLRSKRIRIDAPPCAYISRISFTIKLLKFCASSIPTTPCSISMRLHILLRIPTNNAQTYTYVQFPAHGPRNPRHAYAPPSLGCEPAWLRL
jgi:hypothetical protein